MATALADSPAETLAAMLSRKRAEAEKEYRRIVFATIDGERLDYDALVRVLTLTGRTDEQFAAVCEKLRGRRESVERLERAKAIRAQIAAADPAIESEKRAATEKANAIQKKIEQLEMERNAAFEGYRALTREQAGREQEASALEEGADHHLQMTCSRVCGETIRDLSREWNETMPRLLNPIARELEAIDVAEINEQMKLMEYCASNGLVAARHRMTVDEAKDAVKDCEAKLARVAELEAKRERVYDEELGPLEDECEKAKKAYLDWRRVDWD